MNSLKSQPSLNVISETQKSCSALQAIVSNLMLKSGKRKSRPKLGSKTVVLLGFY